MLANEVYAAGRAVNLRVRPKSRSELVHKLLCFRQDVYVTGGVRR
jgi:hypothetical protein